MTTSMSSLRSNEDTGDKRSTRIEETRGGFVLTGQCGDLLTRRNSFDDKSKKGFLSVSFAYSIINSFKFYYSQNVDGC